MKKPGEPGWRSAVLRLCGICVVRDWPEWCNDCIEKNGWPLNNWTPGERPKDENVRLLSVSDPNPEPPAR
jgi:hypothetical protein